MKKFIVSVCQLMRSFVPRHEINVTPGIEAISKAAFASQELQFECVSREQKTDLKISRKHIR